MADLQKPIKESEIGNLNDLPEELLEIVFEYLWHNPKNFRFNAVVDLIRLSAVCKKWQRLSSRVKKQSCVVACPFVLILENTQLFRLLGFPNNTSKEIRCHNSHTRYVCNSWNEWLVIVDVSLGPLLSGFQINFYNLFSNARVLLPTPVLDNPSIGLGIHKAIASCPTLDPNCVIMAIHGSYFKLAFCKVGDERWTILEGEPSFYEDILYYKNEFYGIGKNGILVVCDFNCPEPKTIQVASTILKPGVRNKFYLAESSDDLLLIAQRVGHEQDIEVYKMDFSRHEWTTVNSFGGDNSIFIGRNISICVSTKDLFITGDCIYLFTRLYYEYGRRSSISVFNMKTKRFVSEELSQSWIQILDGIGVFLNSI